MNELKGLKVAVLATDGFEQSELTEPVKALRDAGAEVEILAPKAGEIQGYQHHDKADKVTATRSLSDARPEEFDAVHLPGGALNADKLRMDAPARAFIQAMDRAQKPVAAICHAAWLLVSAGLTKGRKLTSYYTIQDDIRNAGGNWVDEKVVRDNNWVTSRQPSDLPAYNQAMIELFNRSRAHAEAAPSR